MADHVGCEPGESERSEQPDAAAQTVTQQFQISGMTCGHCVQAVTEELSALDGVQGVEVDLDSGTATVRSSAELDLAAVQGAVDEAGYELV